MFSFEIIKKSESSDARLGILKTPHGNIETPAFIFCATKANLKGVTINHVKQENTQIILSNTYHLMLQPGSEIIKQAGGLHKFVGWDGPMFTDSGGFQIFSLGYGNVESEIKGARLNRYKKTILSLTEQGAKFRSYKDGEMILLTPELSMQIQRDLGADIIVAFDECTPYHVSKLYTENSMEKSKRWATRCLQEFEKFDDKKQALLAVIQGGVYKDLRRESANFANNNNFAGFAIGGSLGKTMEEMHDIVSMTSEMLDKSKYVHLLGIGGIEDIFHGCMAGIDTFDCVGPTRMARHGAALVKKKESFDRMKYSINLNNAVCKNDFTPISVDCNCYTCQNFSKAYIHHLFKAKEVLGGILLSIHNVHTMNKLMSDIREALKTDSLAIARKKWCEI